MLRPSLRRSFTVLVLLALSACGRAPQPVPPESLVIRINILCTTCDEFLRCEDPGKPAESRVYRLREKSFWAQVATIWDYLVQWIRRKTTDARPVTLYLERGDVRTRIDLERAAQLDLVAGRLSVDDTTIDLRDGTWRATNGEPRGTCVQMPRREGYALVRRWLGRPLPTGAP
jgi:hypothetical protein